MLKNLLRRACTGGCVRSRADAAAIVSSVVSLSSVSAAGDADVVSAGRWFVSRDSDLVADVVKEGILMDDVAGGRSLAMMMELLGEAGCEQSLWEQCVLQCERGLRTSSWEPAAVSAMLKEIAKWQVYPPTMSRSIEQYVASRISEASSADAVCLAECLVSIPEGRTSSLLADVAARVATVAEDLQENEIRVLCSVLSGAEHRSVDIVTVLVEFSPDWCASCSGVTCANALNFCLMHPEFKSEDPESVELMLNTLAMRAEDLSLADVERMLQSMQGFPPALRESVEAEHRAALTAVLERSIGCIEETFDELPVADIVKFITNFFEFSRAMAKVDPTFPTSILEEVEVALGDKVDSRLEDLVSEENPPFFIIEHFLSAKAKAAKQTGAAVLREASLQKVHFTALQTFQYLLALTEEEVYDRVVFRHLRQCFCSTAKGVPMIQLCTVLKCFIKAEEHIPVDVDNDAELHEEAAFREYCEEMALKATDMDVRCAIALVDCMHQLGHTSELFYDRLVLSMSSLIQSAQPGTQSKAAAQRCLGALAGRLEGYENVKQFLTEAAAEGIDAEPTTPMKWMNENDPANFIAPMSPEQQEMWNIIQEMRETHASDTETMSKLANSYLELLDHARVGDLQFFFEVFADKVIKNDKLLNEALKRIIASERLLVNLPGATIGGILHNLGQIRFGYYATLKKFILAITEEQWSTMEPANLVIVVGGLAKLSLRLSAPLLHIGERIAAIHTKLMPMETALLINALQSLGYGDETVLSMLMAHAAKNAYRYDDGAMTLLFGSSSIHRLLVDGEVAKPLLEHACRRDLSPSHRLKLAGSLRKTNLPRDLLDTTIGRLEAPPISSKPRLTGASAGHLHIES